METGYQAVLWFVVLAAIVTPLLLAVGAFLRPKRKIVGLGAEAYECGEAPRGDAKVKFNFRFYVVALVFLLFEVEIAAVFPLCVRYRFWIQNARGGEAFLAIFLFIALLFLGLLYCWRRGDLDWLRQEGSGK